uniref:Polyamine aminopropyltransferase n=1 Tax=uncultured delta proteobacterium DeepAnt-32C6 TaxID=357895 RepID=Q2I6L2_9DELT|nr:Spermidine synthase [uncultured delta proteobacterium DeepAnt-32C6]
MTSPVGEPVAEEPVPLLLKRFHAFALLTSVFIVAGCGLAYELTMSTAAAFFLGDTILQFSLTIGIFLAGLGLGAHLSKHLRGDLLRTFVMIEIAIAALGGASAALIYVAYGWDYSVRGITILLPAAVGILVGLEIPLLTRLLSHAGGWTKALSNVLSLDYLGGLAASLIYPLVLLPEVGVVRSAIVFGIFNATTGLVTALIFRRSSAGTRKLVPVAAITLALLFGMLLAAGPLIGAVEKRLYGGELVASFNSRYQHIAVSRRGEHTELFLDGHLQFSSADEARYHEVLAHPAMGATPHRADVLVIGGGDGLLVREILRWPAVKRLTLVDLDRELVELCQREPDIVAVNGGALSDARVKIINADGFVWLQGQQQRFDRIFLDLPDPRSEGVARLYSVEFFELVKRHLRAQGILAAQATSPYYTPRVFWSIVSSMEEAAFTVSPAHVNVPSLGEWGFVFAAMESHDYAHGPLPDGLRFLSPEIVPSVFLWPRDLQRVPVDATHFDRPIVLRYYADDSAQWGTEGIIH